LVIRTLILTTFFSFPAFSLALGAFQEIISSTPTTAESVVTDPYDLTAPSLSLSLGDCPEITTPTPITGSVSDANELSYQLRIRPQNATLWATLAEGSGNVQGELAVLDPTFLKNGVYQIELSAEDVSGNQSFVRGCAVVDGGIKLRHVNLAATDLEVQEQGLPLALKRAYDSRSTSGDFGTGWSLPHKEVTVQPTRELAGGTFATYYLIEKYRHQLVVRLPDDQLLKFRMDVNPKSSLVYPIEGQMPLTVSWLPDELTGATLEALNAETILRLTGSYLREYADDLYNPTRFRITLPEGTKYVVRMGAGLESMTDVYGHTITYQNNSIRHSSGATVSFQRDTENRINRVTGPQGQQLVYHYDENGMLEKVMQEGPEPPYTRTLALLGSEFRMTFGKPSLKEIMAPDGTVLGSIEYVDGRMTALIDADGNKMIYGYDINNLSQEITDRNGNTTNYTFDVKGNVTSKTDPLGNVTHWTYDARNNKLSGTDPLGNTTSFAYDASNNLISETDPLGGVTRYTYNSKRKVTSTTDPLGNVTTNTYDTHGDLWTSTDALGNVTTHDYNQDGNLESITNGLGHVTRYTYDGKGNRTSETDPLGNTTTYTFDYRGRNEPDDPPDHGKRAGVIHHDHGV
jgi:YD repeat-containing protein